MPESPSTHVCRFSGDVHERGRAAASFGSPRGCVCPASPIADAVLRARLLVDSHHVGGRAVLLSHVLAMTVSLGVANVGNGAVVP